MHKDSYGVTWIDDSKATNVEATYTGLLGLKEQQSVILLGGLAKVTLSFSFFSSSFFYEQLSSPITSLKCMNDMISTLM